MKKKLILLIIFFTPVLVFSASKNIGYGFSLGENTSEETSLDLNLRYSIFRLEGGIQLDKDFKVNTSGLTLALDIDLFKTERNIFSFTQVNTSLWSPSISIGGTTDFKSILGYAEVSLIRIREKDFMYEWFPVSITFDFSGICSWKVCVFRYTKLF